MPLPLEDYGMIGDCQTAALVGRDGSIDWLCFPSFDSPACFAALLGTPQNGRWLLAPLEKPVEVRRCYRDDTLILETDYETSEGAVTVVDCMPPRTEEPDLIRLLLGRRGTVRMQMELVIRFDYGSFVPWVRKVEGGIYGVAGRDTLTLYTPVELRGEDLTTKAEFTVQAGDEIPMVLMWQASHLPRPKAIDAQRSIQFAEDWWRKWSSQCNYDGPWRAAVMRSLITLKALTFAPTGGIVAAPTTSLPERLGGERNWDYRYCWLRDATFTLYALLQNGFTAEAVSFRDWLLRMVAGDPTALHIMYSIFGDRRLTEVELPWLAGYEDSRPVRTGNAASRQFQLDVYGEVLDMLYLCRRQGLDEDESVWRFEKALLRYLATAWKEPDEGIWEVRGPRRHFTHSKAMAWVAFDRAIKAVECGKYQGPVDQWRSIRKAIHAEICQHGFNQRRGAFVQYFDGDELDASLLMLPLVGFLSPHDPRLAGTVAAIQRHLTNDGFVSRYATRPHIDGLPPGEASFLPCSFWLVDNLVLLGQRDEAEELFERLLAVSTDLGLLAEEYDAAAGRLVGNFPQAFTHVGVVNSARNLTQAEGPAEHRRKES